MGIQIVLRALLGLGLVSGSTGRVAVGQGSGSTTLPIMPLPAKVTQGAGEFVVDGQFSVGFEGFQEPRLTRARQRFLDVLGRETGIPLARAAGGVFQPANGQPKDGTARLLIKTGGPSAQVQQLGEDESYTLEVEADVVHLTAANPLGVLHGLQTFLQLVRVTPRGFSVPVVTIEDKPRFPWRGLMIDSARHFTPLPVIERNLDAMEAVKLNVFHWHLSDDQGFRVESKVFPLLQNKGSDGLYYTQEEIRHTLEYARDRGIRVVPEFDMPGHAMAWFVGYPQLASGKGPYSIERHWGVFDPAMDATKEGTYQFLNQFIGEMTGLFPDAYFHIGGDECNGKEWDRNPQIQAFMKAHDLKNDAALQAYFSGRVQKLVTARHKITVGWDEVLQPNTPKDVVIQSWRGRKSLLDAAKRGYRGLLSNGYYIDLNESAEQHYLVDPLAGIEDQLTPEQTASILGGEATIWSEYVDGEIIDSRIWPRTAAIAERFWSAGTVRDVDSMYARMAIEGNRLTSYGVSYKATSERMLERMSGEADPEALRVLASTVEPPKEYEREGLRTGVEEYSSWTPLNHLVDAVAPESETAREFRLICTRIAAGKAAPEDWQKAREWLNLWQGNDAKLQPELGKSFLLVELGGISKSLSEVAGIGLGALGGLQQGKAVSAELKEREMKTLAEAEKPDQKSVLLLVVAPSVEMLVKAERAN